MEKETVIFSIFGTDVECVPLELKDFPNTKKITIPYPKLKRRIAHMTFSKEEVKRWESLFGKKISTSNPPRWVRRWMHKYLVREYNCHRSKIIIG